MLLHSRLFRFPTTKINLKSISCRNSSARFPVVISKIEYIYVHTRGVMQITKIKSPLCNSWSCQYKVITWNYLDQFIFWIIHDNQMKTHCPKFLTIVCCSGGRQTKLLQEPHAWYFDMAYDNAVRPEQLLPYYILCTIVHFQDLL